VLGNNVRSEACSIPLFRNCWLKKRWFSAERYAIMVHVYAIYYNVSLDRSAWLSQVWVVLKWLKMR